MRISECAELTGTTVRTIRYYHQIGLLPAPEGRGRRDYGLDEVARILRIRWLAEAGLSLDAVAELLAVEAQDVEAQDGEPVRLRDLRATATSIDARIADLQAQRHRITGLIELAEQGRPLTATPPAITAFYERLEAVVTDPHARGVLDRERRLAEMFAQRGLITSRAEEWLSRFTDEDVTWLATVYTRYARLATLDEDASRDETDALVDDIDRWCRDNLEITAGLLHLLPAWARRPRTLNALVEVSTLAFTGRHQGEVIRRGVAGLVRLAAEKGIAL